MKNLLTMNATELQAYRAQLEARWQEQFNTCSWQPCEDLAADIEEIDELLARRGYVEAYRKANP